MPLAIFDLDHTLLNGDSDHAWGDFLVKKNLVDGEAYKLANEKFYDQYKQGTLDIYKYAEFSFQPLTEHSKEKLAELHAEFMKDVISPMIGDKAKSLVNHHRQQDHVLLVITATNSFIARPIVDAFGIKHLLATEPKIAGGRYVNSIEGTPCFKEGKVKRLQEWLDQENVNLDGSYFYSDSHNDCPLMEQVANAIAVDPDEQLKKIAKQKGWKIISLLG